METKQQIVADWLPRYTGVSLKQFGRYILLTNFDRYVELFARWHRVPVHGRMPRYQPNRIGGETGGPITIGEPNSPAARSVRAAAEQLAAQLSRASYRKRSIPLRPIG